MNLRSFAFSLIALALPLAAQVEYKLAPVGPGCGPKLNASFSDLGGHKRLELPCTNLFPSEFGIIAYGASQVNIQFPDNCTLWTIPVFSHTFRSDALGTYDGGHAWPESIYAQVIVQVATFKFDANNELVIKFTNAVKATHMP